MSSNAIPPSVTFPSPNEWPETVFAISHITNASQATITCSTYTFTSADIEITSVLFKQVNGMLPINGLPGLIQSVLSSTQFTVNIDTTNFPTYTSGGVICILTGEPPSETEGFQIMNTPFKNTYSSN